MTVAVSVVVDPDCTDPTSPNIATVGGSSGTSSAGVSVSVGVSVGESVPSPPHPGSPTTPTAPSALGKRHLSDSRVSSSVYAGAVESSVGTGSSPC
jgi:hypothetical protein